jgi:hypothetical protein
VRNAGSRFAESTEGAGLRRRLISRLRRNPSAAPVPAGSGARSGRSRRRAARWLPIFAATVLGALAIASVAGANLGIVGYLAFTKDSTTLVDDAPGEVEEPGGIAVNASGAGGASAGDAYLLDDADGRNELKGVFTPPATGRVSQVSPSGEVLRIWGEDVVERGPGQSDETQTATVDATGGTFTLSFPQEAARGAAVVTRGSFVLENVSTEDGAFAVGQSIEGAGILAGTTITAIGVSTITLSQAAEKTSPVPGTPILASGPASSTTLDLPATATAGQVEAALNGLATVSASGGAVSVTGGPGDAGGTTPYLVTFDGGPLAGTDQPQLIAAEGSSPLSGGASTAVVETIDPGAAGFEICTPAQGDTCKQALGLSPTFDRYRLGGNLNGPEEVAIDQVSGDVYVTADTRVSRFSATGQFLRAWGLDVVRSGPDDSSVDEQIKVTVKASSGTFTVSYPAFPEEIRETTAPIPYNATPAQLKSALEALPDIGGVGGTVSVTGGPGDAGGSNPYIVTFGGTLGGDDLATTTSSSPASVSTIANGGAPEVCTPLDVCQRGQNSETTPGVVGNASRPIDVFPPGGPHAGNVLVVGGGGAINEFTPQGEFVRGMGWDIDATEPGTGFEVCAVSSGHTCKGATFGYDGLGEFGLVSGLAADSTGAIYVTDDGQTTRRTGNIQKLTPSGGEDLTPSNFGDSETQAVTVDASSGQFRLAARMSQGNTGNINGSYVAGQTTFGNFTLKGGAFEVGQEIRGGSLPEGAKVTAVGPTSISVSPGMEKTSGIGASTTTLTSTRYDTTPDLSFEATPAQVESALNELPAIFATVRGNGFAKITSGSKTVTGVNVGQDGYAPFAVGQKIAGPGIPPGTTIAAKSGSTLTLSQAATASSSAVVVEAGIGSVSVSGGPGDAGGNNPYLVTFDGGPLAHGDQPLLLSSQGTAPLAGGTGPDANQAVVTTPTPGGASGFVSSQAPSRLAIGPADSVLVVKNYPRGQTLCPNGLESPGEARIMSLDSSGAVNGVSNACGGEIGSIRGLAANVVNGHAYVSTAGPGQLRRAFIFDDPGLPPELTVNPLSEETAESVVVSGTVNPRGPGPASYPNIAATTYRVQLKKSSDTDWVDFAPDTPVGAGVSPAEFKVGVGGLTPNTAYDFRVVVEKPYGGGYAVGPVQQVVTLPGKPLIGSFSSSNVTASSADLNALINPLGTATSYHFEYGTTPSYGQETPEVDIGESADFQSISAHLDDLLPRVYHFRVVASNSAGTTTTTDQTFAFYPESCPNAGVRQQAGSDALPDCRAYELVSPKDAGTALLTTGGPSGPLASNPPRFGFQTEIGSIPVDGNPPSNFKDQYMATRTPTGWQTDYVGFPANISTAGARPPFSLQIPSMLADDSLNLFLQWRGGGEVGGSDPTSTVEAYLWDSKGEERGHVPTNVAEVPLGGATPSAGGPVGESRISGDGGHYVFSTANIAFAPSGRTSEGGSVYDNDLTDETVTVASKLQNGTNILREPGDLSNDFMTLPAISRDGSHVLMGFGEKGLCGSTFCQDAPNVCTQVGVKPSGGGLYAGCVYKRRHLYMRVDGTVTYDVSGGSPVEFEGMTADGSKVVFTSNEPITADDHDTSVDVFMWSEESDSITRLSTGTGGTVGDTDGCNAVWVTKCGAVVVPATGGGVDPVNPDTSRAGFSTDNSVAAGNGSVYFYSPEQLVGAKGVPAKRNLYVYREGEIKYVATVDSDRPLSRIQVSPDGRYGAWVTTSRLISYDNSPPSGGCFGLPSPAFGGDQCAEMYKYDAVTEDMRCVSCIPSGARPGSDVRASADGRFMSDDGRPFFYTADALIPADSNGSADVYEYVSGRPRLISSGSGEADRFRPLALIGVSADGIDVYFSTNEVLVEGDRNGNFLKFYDARAVGGFPSLPPPIPCAAADECHGAAAPGAPIRRIASTADLGAGGGNISVSRCAALARRSGSYRRRAAALRRRASKLSGHRSRVLRGKAKREARRSQRTRRAAKRCRAMRSAQSSRRAGR